MGVLEPFVCGARVDQVSHAQLMDVAQSLERTRIEHFHVLDYRGARKHGWGLSPHDCSSAYVIIPNMNRRVKRCHM